MSSHPAALHQMLLGARGAAPEAQALVHEHVRTLMDRRQQLQQAQQMLQQARGAAPDAQNLVRQHAQTLLSQKTGGDQMGPQMTKLAAKLHARCPHCGVCHAGKHNAHNDTSAAKTAAHAFGDRPTDILKALGIISAVPVGAAGLSAAAAPDDERLRSALMTGGSSALGGLAGGSLGAALGERLFYDRRVPLSGLVGLLSGGALGGLGGQVGGAALGHHLAKKTREQPSTTDDKKTAMEALRDKLAQRGTPMQQHALNDAWRAHAQTPVSTQMPMRMSPQDMLARQQMLQNPQMFAGGGGAPSGLELAHPLTKRSSEIEKLRQKIALAPLAAALPAIGGAVARSGLMAGARSLLGAGARVAANPLGNMVMQTGMQTGAQQLMQPKPQPRGPLPGQIGGV